MRSKAVVFVALLSLLVLGSIDSAVGQVGREEWQPPEAIMDSIGVEAGMTIGEPGAGRGYLTFYLAQRVGDKGKIYANDIDKGSLDYIESRAKKEGIGNITTVLGETEDPLFPADDLDMIVMVYVLHMLEKPLSFMENLKEYMRPDTPLVIIEKDTLRERAHPPSYMTKQQILATIQTTGYTLERIETFLPRDTIYIFKLEED